MIDRPGLGELDPTAARSTGRGDRDGAAVLLRFMALVRVTFRR
jgi:hypothetical protein